MKWQVAVPAYGRDFRSQADVRAAWERGLDFLAMPTEQYVNKAEADSLGLTMQIRYAKLRKFLVIHPLSHWSSPNSSKGGAKPMTQPEIEFAVRDVEALLEKHDIHLNTDDFNTLYDFIEARIRENGQ